MKRLGSRPFLISRLLEGFPALFHGFGTKTCGMRDIRMAPRGRDLRLITLDQTHSDTIRFFARPPRRRLSGDALATDRPGFLLAVKTADCLPILLFDPDRRATAAVHCGWRGTAARIAEKAVRALARKYGCRPSAIRAALGPCIGRRCYEVGEDVRRAFRKAGLSLRDFRTVGRRRGKYVLDLAGANRRQLIAAGLRRSHIDRLDLCTHCRPDLRSYRRDAGDRGRLINFIGLE